MGIGINKLITLKTGINVAAKHYNLPPLAATLQLIDDTKTYNKINDIKKELTALQLQKYALDQACSRQSQSLIALVKLKNHGISEEQIMSLGNMLQGNQIKL